MSSKKSDGSPKVRAKSPISSARGKPDKIIAAIDGIEIACGGNAAFQAKPACVSALAAVTAKRDELKKNQKALVGFRKQVTDAEHAESTIVGEIEGAVGTFVSTVEEAGKDDPKFVEDTNLVLRRRGVRIDDPAVPDGVRGEQLANGDHVFGWNEVVGAHLYQAQIRRASVPNAAFEPVYGGGKTRKIPDPVPGETYEFQVATIAWDGRPTAFSAIASYTIPKTAK